MQIDILAIHTILVHVLEISPFHLAD